MGPSERPVKTNGREKSSIKQTKFFSVIKIFFLPLIIIALAIVYYQRKPVQVHPKKPTESYQKITKPSKGCSKAYELFLCDQISGVKNQPWGVYETSSSINIETDGTSYIEKAKKNLRKNSSEVKANTQEYTESMWLLAYAYFTLANLNQLGKSDDWRPLKITLFDGKDNTSKAEPTLHVDHLMGLKLVKAFMDEQKQRHIESKGVKSIEVFFRKYVRFETSSKNKRN